MEKSEDERAVLICKGMSMTHRSTLLDISKIYIDPKSKNSPYAGVAQLVEQLICNQQVAGSSPFASSNLERELF